MTPAAFVDAENWVLALMFASVRPAAAFLAAPSFALARVPPFVRVLAGLSVGILLIDRAGPPPSDLRLLPILLAGETLIGLAIGLVAQLAVGAVAMAGELVSAALGLSFATLFDPANGQSSAAGELFRLLGALLFLTGGGHEAMVVAVAGSYASLPPGASLPAASASALSRLGGDAIAAGVAIALPAVVALLALNLAAGFVTRIAPQLNMFAVAVPATLTAGLIALLILFDGMALSAASAVDRLTATGLTLIR